MTAPLSETSYGKNRILWFDTVGSTNDVCAAQADLGAEDGLVVAANYQTAGRGRGDRDWVSSPQDSLTFSLLVRPTPGEHEYVARFTALAGLALVEVLAGAFNLRARVKWPNDVLLEGKKLCGILAETRWNGTLPAFTVIGVGVNLDGGAYQGLQAPRYPVTSLGEVLKSAPAPADVLRLLLDSVNALRPILAEDAFITLWNERLAFKGDWVHMNMQKGATSRVRILHVNPDASLSVEDEMGQIQVCYSSEISSPGS